jgi:LemA protein
MNDPGLYIVIAICAALLIAPVLMYNRFISQRNLIENSWANIDTELKRRYELIPNLVETVKGYAAHERAVFEEVTRARSAAQTEEGTPNQQAAIERPLVTALRQLLAVAENYPELKASTHFLDLQNQLTNTEDRIQAARRFYNANVRDFNTRVDAFPSNLIARLFRFRRAEFFHVDAAVREAPQVQMGA